MSSSPRLIDNRSRTKILCTLGPASSSEEVLTKMMKSGMDCVRFNFSHGTHEGHEKLFNLVRNISKKIKQNVSILCDIQGPKIRVGEMEKEIQVQRKQTIKVTSEKIVGNEKRIQISYPHLCQDLSIDDRIFINDGIIELKVIDKNDKDLICEVLNGGIISSRKGCNLPSGNLAINVVTKKDEKDLELIAKLNPEFLAVSFVGCSKDILDVKKRLSSLGNDNIKVIAKIERPNAVKNIDEIISVSDGIMVARGDLGVEIPVFEVPRVQKDIVRKANQQGIYAIIATQMLESMTQNSRPTRAEANDVYNAVIDGADAVMLSGETSVGKDPVNVVRTMDQIVYLAEKHIPLHDSKDLDSGKQVLVETFGHIAYTLSNLFLQKNWKGKLLVISDSGHTTRWISKFRSPIDMIAITTSERTFREMSLLWGVRDYVLVETENMGVEEENITAIKECKKRKLLESDLTTHVAVISSTKFGTNLSIYDLNKIDLK
eukprot:gene106-4355_t